MKINFNKAIIFFSLFILTGIIFNACNRQVSVTPPDALPPNGFVYVSSEPEGFQIYLNGKQQRRITPDSIKWLSSGTYQITLKKDLFRDTSFYVNVKEGNKNSVFVNFTDNALFLGNIFCDSKPEKAEIFLNDKNTGAVTPSTLYEILPGNYEVRYHLQNYQDDSVNITVSSGNTSNVSMSLLDTLMWQIYNTTNSPIKINDLTCIGVDKNDVVWVGTEGYGVMSFNGSTWSGSQLFPVLPDKNINCITVDNNNVMFFGTNRGFVTYDGSQEKVYSYRTAVLPDYTINAICFDSSGNWYIGTLGGVSKSIMLNGARIWTTLGISLAPDALGRNPMVPDGHINCLICDNDQNLWVGMNSMGISIIKKDNTDWQLDNNNNSHILNDNIRAFALSPSGSVWVGFGYNGYSCGLSYYDGASWHNIGFLPTYSQTNAIFIDKYNTKWVATNQGLVEITSTSKVTTFNKATTNLPIDDVTGIAQDSKGNIWISTYGGGLVEYKGNH